MHIEFNTKKFFKNYFTKKKIKKTYVVLKSGFREFRTTCVLRLPFEDAPEMIGCNLIETYGSALPLFSIGVKSLNNQHISIFI